MRVVFQDTGCYVLRFDLEEEVMEGLLEFAAQNEIDAASLTGIGACSFIELAFYNPTAKNYDKREFSEELEICSLLGNIALLEGKPVLHAHGIFGKKDFSTIGGHVLKLVVSATCEIVLTKLEGTLLRKHNEKMNLNLLA